MGNFFNKTIDITMSAEDQFTMANFEMQCGQAVSTSCEGKSVASGRGFTEASFKKFIGGAVNVFTAGLNVFLATSTQAFSENMMMGINALRCAVVNAADNAWNFIAAAWPYICTCNEDMDFISQMMGASGEGAAVFSS